MVFAGVGLVALPVDLIKAFVGRPRTTISRSEHLKRAQGLGNRAKQIKVCLIANPNPSPLQSASFPPFPSRV